MVKTDFKQTLDAYRARAGEFRILDVPSLRYLMVDEFIPGQRLTMTGGHDEIYLGDPGRVAPAKLRTILRQPVNEA